MSRRARLAASLLLPAALMISACRSHRIDAAVENRTGGPVEEVEVDYPSASFGADRLDAGADYRYRLQVRGSGPVSVEYRDPATHQLHRITGPELSERQQGLLEIVLLPGGRAEFHPRLGSGG